MDLAELVDDVVARLLHVDLFAGHPRVLADLLDGEAVGAVVGEHLDDEVLEVGGEVLRAGLLPIRIKIASEDEAVEVFVFLCLLEGENSLNDDEQYDRSREHIDLHAIIDLTLLDLGRHVGHGAAVALQRVDFAESGKSEVSDLEVHLFVDEDVL